jgi:hypothetical protein
MSDDKPNEVQQLIDPYTADIDAELRGDIIAFHQHHPEGYGIGVNDDQFLDPSAAVQFFNGYTGGDKQSASLDDIKRFLTEQLHQFFDYAEREAEGIRSLSLTYNHRGLVVSFAYSKRDEPV